MRCNEMKGQLMVSTSSCLVPRPSATVESVCDPCSASRIYYVLYMYPRCGRTEFTTKNLIRIFEKPNSRDVSVPPARCASEDHFSWITLSTLR